MMNVAEAEKNQMISSYSVYRNLVDSLLLVVGYKEGP